MTKGPVVPLIYNSRYTKDKDFPVKGGQIYGWPSSKVKVRRCFPYALAFSMTIHKAQGQTIDRLILCLSERKEHRVQMDWSSLYVALSRVKCRNSLRILTKNLYRFSTRDPSCPECTSTLQYMKSFKAKVEVGIYFRGFRHSKGSSWDLERAYNMAAL